jgi:polyisoprenoid-binding protein YceI
MSTQPQAVSVPRYEIDASHSSAQFKVRHMMISNVKGEFPKVSGTVTFDPSHPEASAIDVTIDAASIHTRDAQRDEHLRSADFLDVANYPALTFKSQEVVGSGVDSYEVVGDLTIRGTTRRVSLSVDSVTPEVKDPWGNLRRGATATTTISRKEFGLVWNVALETGGMLVGDDVHITIDVQMMRKV